MLPTAEGSAEPMKVDPLDLTCGTSQGRDGSAPAHGSPSSVKNGDVERPARDQAAAGYSGFEPSSVPGEEPHRCDICGKTFAVPARLTRHYRTHTGERPFVCELCGKSFSVKENLSVHRRIHTKEKPYGCTHCGRGFEHSGKLHRHMRIHTGERPHQCTDCGKTFIQSGQLVIHMRSHTGEKPYVCSVCHKGFTCSKQLKVHSRTHTGERPYACDVCGKTFAYNHVLKLHQMAHLGERLYKCTLCSETYSSKKALESHIKSHSSTGARLSPVPSTSARPPAGEGRGEPQTVRASRTLTSGGSFVERSAVGVAGGPMVVLAAPAPSVAGAPVELGGSRSPSSGENSRSSSISEADSAAGPSGGVEFAAGQGPAPLAAAPWPLSRHNDQLHPQMVAPSAHFAHSHLLNHNVNRQLAESAALHHYGAHPQGRQAKSSSLPPMPSLVPVASLPRSALQAHLSGVKVRESDVQPAAAAGDGGALSNMPPRKQARFRHECDSSAGSDSSRENSPYSPPDCLIASKCPSVANSLKADDAISVVHADQVVRSTSVICFARRPSSSGSASSSQ